MALGALVLSEIGLCLSWIPHYGWLGIAVATAAVVLGILSLGRTELSPGSLAYSVIAVLLGAADVIIGLTYQFKALNLALWQLPVLSSIQACVAIGTAALFAGFLGMLLARSKHRAFGMTVLVVAIVALVVCGTLGLWRADRQFAPNHPPSSVSHLIEI